MKKSNIVLTVLASLAIAASAWPETTAPSGIADILRQARTYQLQFRAGQYDVAPKFVAMLEEATKANPESADLWETMGLAYLGQAAGTALTGGKPADAWTAGQEGQQALERALQLNPDHAEALAIHGGMQAIMASLMKSPGQAAKDQAAKGVAEMNRAVELAPNSTRARLARAFNGLNLPDALRNNAAEAEDLDFLIKTAGRSRSGDYMHIMRGDLYFELGQVDLAKSQYEIASKSASPAAAEATERLTALTLGGVATTDIKKLRSVAGAQCALCHGR